jgi:plasmid stabilization system protein ParE
LRLDKAALETLDLLAQSPELGQVMPRSKKKYGDVRIWQVKGFPNHLVFYRPSDDRIEVLRILHASRDWQNLLGR